MWTKFSTGDHTTEYLQVKWKWNYLKAYLTEGNKWNCGHIFCIVSSELSKMTCEKYTKHYWVGVTFVEIGALKAILYSVYIRTFDATSKVGEVLYEKSAHNTEHFSSFVKTGLGTATFFLTGWHTITFSRVPWKRAIFETGLTNVHFHISISFYQRMHIYCD